PHRSSLAQSCTKPLWRGRYSPHSVFYSPPLNTAYFLSTRLQNEMSLQIPLRPTHTALSIIITLSTNTSKSSSISTSSSTTTITTTITITTPTPPRQWRSTP